MLILKGFHIIYAKICIVCLPNNIDRIMLWKSLFPGAYILRNMWYKVLMLYIVEYKAYRFNSIIILSYMEIVYQYYSFALSSHG